MPNFRNPAKKSLQLFSAPIRLWFTSVLFGLLFCYVCCSTALLFAVEVLEFSGHQVKVLLFGREPAGDRKKTREMNIITEIPEAA